MDKVIRLATIFIIVLSGCKSTPTALKPHPPPVDVQKQVIVVGTVKDAIYSNAASIKADAIGIKTQVSAGLSIQPDSKIFELIGIKAGTIEESTDGILSETVKLTAVQTQLEKVKTDFALLQKDFADSQKMVKERDTAAAEAALGHSEAMEAKNVEIAKLKDAVTAKIKLWLTIATLAFIAVAAAAVGFGIYLGKPRLFIFAPVFLGCASLTYFVSSYLKEILIFGGCVFVALIGYAIWRWKEEQDELKKNKTALVQSVTAIEKTDDATWAKLKPLIVDAFSKDTTKLVDTIRTDIKEISK